MKNIISPKPVVFFVVFASVLISCANMYYTADTIASETGYFVALVIIPSIIGSFFGSIGSAIVKGEIVKGIKVYWWFPVVGLIASLAPVGYVTWVMSLPNH
ncbi:MAG: hypothetical protein ACYDBT_15845 [Desulfobulbaceae bacterium]